ncbi:hypothetical protein NPIL_528351, partial [Nephila pilipes]
FTQELFINLDSGSQSGSGSKLYNFNKALVISKTVPPFLEDATEVVETVCSIPNFVNRGQSLKGAFSIDVLPRDALTPDEDSWQP